MNRYRTLLRAGMPAVLALGMALPAALGTVIPAAATVSGSCVLQGQMAAATSPGFPVLDIAVSTLATPCAGVTGTGAFTMYAPCDMVAQPSSCVGTATVSATPWGGCTGVLVFTGGIVSVSCKGSGTYNAVLLAVPTSTQLTGYLVAGNASFSF